VWAERFWWNLGLMALPLAVMVAVVVAMYLAGEGRSP
jgi:hypothetical protein